MRALNSNSHLLLIDINTSLHSTNQIPISTISNFVSSTFRRTRKQPRSNGISRSSSSIKSTQIRRPSDRFFSSSNGFSSHENGSSSVLSNSLSISRSEVNSELEMLLELLPLKMKSSLFKNDEIGNLIEIVMDLGRKPIARFPTGDWMISDQPVMHDDLLQAISKVGEFSDDNRSGIDHSLHRISAIRNRKMQVIGLTCRVGRAISGSAESLRDLVEGGGSILVIGPPGVGKTTLIREIARMLADEYMKRVVIVDTSNEIGGDGDVPHSGIGSARRMQVPNVNMQHNVMIEAVENHMPESIIIDEIGTELEALAASTIAQRGVQLVGTAHGMTIDNIIKNPSLQLLVGGIEIRVPDPREVCPRQASRLEVRIRESHEDSLGLLKNSATKSVTLGDEEARKRKVQKTILERKGSPTFTCAVEIISRTECRVHHRLDATVDAILAGKTPLFEVRHLDTEALDSSRTSLNIDRKHFVEKYRLSRNSTNHKEENVEVKINEEGVDLSPINAIKWSSDRSLTKRKSPLSVYVYKILETDLLQVATVMGLADDIDVTDDIGTADAILGSSSELKQNPWIRGVAKFHQLPVFVIKSNTMAQMVKAVRMILGIESFSVPPILPLKSSFDIEVEDDAPKRNPTLEEIDALEEVRLAIEYIVIPGGEPVELLPRRSEIIARQLELVECYQLAAWNSGTEMNPRLQILPQKLNKKKATKKHPKPIPIAQKETSFRSITGGGGATSVTQLPFLPE